MPLLAKNTGTIGWLGILVPLVGLEYWYRWLVSNTGTIGWLGIVVPLLASNTGTIGWLGILVHWLARITVVPLVGQQYVPLVGWPGILVPLVGYEYWYYWLATNMKQNIKNIKQIPKI